MFNCTPRRKEKYILAYSSNYYRNQMKELGDRFISFCISNQCLPIHSIFLSMSVFLLISPALCSAIRDVIARNTVKNVAEKVGGV